MGVNSTIISLIILAGVKNPYFFETIPLKHISGTISGSPLMLENTGSEY